MRILLNGESTEISEAHGQNVLTLAEHLGVDLRKAAVERNRQLVPKSQHASTAIRDGDEIEIVQFIGGG